MSLGSILIVGAILLACGFAGLLVVRLDNPRLLGLGWLGAALGSGGIGAVLLLVTSERFLLPSMVLADVMVLASFVLLHLGVMEVLQLRGVPLAGLLLIFLQTAADLFKIQTHASSGFRITVVGILVAAQAAQTVYLLLRHADPSIRSPARFVSLVLFLLMLWNLLRSVATAAGILIARGITYQVEALTFVLYLAAALGLAFGFFWMTTAGLTAQLEELASTDPLTGIQNRRAFLRCFHKEFARSARFADSFALLMLDLDHFKTVNDRYGHIAGDEVLCAAAQNIQDATRGIDCIGRWGGEEFAILLPTANLTTARIVADRILVNIQRAAPLRDRSKHIPITASIGLAIRTNADSVDDIFQRADEALYRAKATGRNRVVWDDQPFPASSQRISGESALAS